MRLIDADSIKFTEYINGDVTVSKEVIQNMPTAFDLESAIEQLERHKEEITNRKERDILNVVAKTNAKAAVEKDIEIIKSATNATNGKNGG